MLEKDAASTTTSLGFRLTGLKSWSQEKSAWIERNKQYGHALTEDNVRPTIREYFEAPHTASHYSGFDWRREILPRFLEQLEAIRDFMSTKNRSLIISSSLLFVHDPEAKADPGCVVKMIDFAHVSPLEKGHERDEGYLTGINNLIAALESFLVPDEDSVREPKTPAAESTGDDGDQKSPAQESPAQESSGDEGVKTPDDNEPEGEEMRCKILVVEYSFSARSEREVDLSEGDRIAVSEEDTSGWWRGKNLSSGETGWFPENYCSKTDEVVTELIIPEEPDSSSESSGEAIFHVPDLTKVPEKSALRVRPEGVSVDAPASHDRRVAFDEEVEVLEMSDDDQWSTSSDDYYGWRPDGDAYDEEDSDDFDTHYEDFYDGEGHVRDVVSSESDDGADEEPEA
jgi:Inositol polyphosphate kinase/SH3 domain